MMMMMMMMRQLFTVTGEEAQVTWLFLMVLSKVIASVATASALQSLTG